MRSLATLRGGIAAVAIAAAAVFAFAPSPAGAHAVCDQSSPSDGSTVQTAPREVSCLFTEPLLPDSSMTVTDACGRRADDGNVLIAGTRMSVGMRETDPGRYTARWVTHSAQDGHYAGPGTITFTVAGTPACPSAGRGSTPAKPGATASATAGGRPNSSQAPDATSSAAASPSESFGAGASPAGSSASDGQRPARAGGTPQDPGFPARTRRPLGAPVAWMLLIILPLGLLPVMAKPVRDDADRS